MGKYVEQVVVDRVNEVSLNQDLILALKDVFEDFAKESGLPVETVATRAYELMGRYYGNG